MFLKKPSDAVRQDGGEALSYRSPMPVSAMRRYGAGALYFPVCPRCGCAIEREYQAYCDRCGQCLNWKGPRTVEERG